MSRKTERIACPNCGYHAEKNYCAQCGQDTHLHAETFLGLVAHFIGHYFHYDSKFWKTLKALWFHPGSLTVAYWKKQRMRYIPPISLYIFVSAVFFIAFFTLGLSDETIREQIHSQTGISTGSHVQDSQHAVGSTPQADNDTDRVRISLGTAEDESIIQRATHTHSNEEAVGALLSQLVHGLPKLFFFLIPVMALALKLLFRRRREYMFVHHAVFSLHLHSFIFTVMLIPLLIPYASARMITVEILLVASMIYLMIAMKNAYTLSWVRSAGYTLLVSGSYVITFFFALLIYLLGLIAYLTAG
jgi:hypothetical protein